MAIPKVVTETYMNPAWHAYNQGLCRLAGESVDAAEPIIAPGCAHIVQRDSPEFVAEQVVKLLGRLCDEHGRST
jgi:pimeloyl-ACP methyl ester carboxylesterase